MERKVSAQQIRAQIPHYLFAVLRLWKQQFSGEGAQGSFLQAETLRFIREHDQPSMRAVAVFLNVAPPSATALIKSLVEDGLVRRVEDAADRRMVRLALTKKGEELLDKMYECRAANFAKLISTLSDDDCRELARILTRITSA